MVEQPKKDTRLNSQVSPTTQMESVGFREGNQLQTHFWGPGLHVPDGQVTNGIRLLFKTIRALKENEETKAVPFCHKSESMSKGTSLRGGCSLSWVRTSFLQEAASFRRFRSQSPKRGFLWIPVSRWNRYLTGWRISEYSSAGLNKSEESADRVFRIAQSISGIAEQIKNELEESGSPAALCSSFFTIRSKMQGNSFFLLFQGKRQLVLTGCFQQVVTLFFHGFHGEPKGSVQF